LDELNPISLAPQQKVGDELKQGSMKDTNTTPHNHQSSSQPHPPASPAAAVASTLRNSYVNKLKITPQRVFSPILQKAVGTQLTSLASAQQQASSPTRFVLQESCTNTTQQQQATNPLKAVTKPTIASYSQGMAATALSSLLGFGSAGGEALFDENFEFSAPRYFDFEHPEDDAEAEDWFEHNIAGGEDEYGVPLDEEPDTDELRCEDREPKQGENIVATNRLSTARTPTNNSINRTLPRTTTAASARLSSAISKKTPTAAASSLYPRKHSTTAANLRKSISAATPQQQGSSFRRGADTSSANKTSITPFLSKVAISSSASSSVRHNNNSAPRSITSTAKVPTTNATKPLHTRTAIKTPFKSSTTTNKAPLADTRMKKQTKTPMTTMTTTVAPPPYTLPLKQPKLTVPKTPNFATAKRVRSYLTEANSVSHQEPASKRVRVTNTSSSTTTASRVTTTTTTKKKIPEVPNLPQLVCISLPS